MGTGNSILSGQGTTVFETMSRLAAAHKAVNLGQGFPDDKGPEDMLALAADKVVDGWNQYPPMMGLPELRQAVAAHDERFYGIKADWQRNVMVTTGATEALAASLLGLIEPGDEVVLIQPLYDAYAPMAHRAGAVVKVVGLQPPHWRIEREALEAAFSDKTKLVLLNNPHNPTARLFDEGELGLVAECCKRHDALALCDEVYEHICFDGRSLRPLMTFPGMEDRCVRIASAGKTFSLTGWKVGYITAPEHLLQPIAKAHQFLVFTTAPNLQAAVAYGLNKEKRFFDDLSTEMQRRRDRLSAGLDRLGFALLPCEATYFLNVDLEASPRLMPVEADEALDIATCQALPEQTGVAAIPVSAFC
ncbi:MAG: aminotransferase, partial [Pseudomonadota bacterium]